MNNQRVHQRYDIRLSAEVTHDGRTFTGTTRNLSAGGCCVESAYPLVESAEVRLDLFIVVDGVEDERMPPLTTLGHVQWSAETDDGQHAAGIQFSSLTDAQQKWLQSFLGKIDHE